MSEGAYTKFEFDINECIEILTNGKGVVLCREAFPIRVDKVVPEIAFRHLDKKIIFFENLTIQNKLGQGAFGTVYKANYQDQEVAVKKKIFFFYCLMLIMLFFF
jgi:hypothetical protein